MINFNSPNKKTGDNFEDDVVSLLQENNCTGIQTNILIKKAIASAPLIKKKYPNSIFNLFFSKPPKKNSSSDNMLKKYMEYGYVDNIVYVNPSDNKTASLETFL